MPLLLPDPIQGVLLDLDGTLVDTEPLHHESTRAVLDAYGHDLSWEDYARFIGVSEIAFWAALRERFGLSEAAPALALRRTEALVTAVRSRRVPLLPGAEALLALLASLGIPAAVASSSPRRQIEATLAAAGVSGLIAAFRSGRDDVPCSKPAPDVYLAAAAALGVPAASCLAVEDSPPGVASARAAGAFVVAVPLPRHAAAVSAAADLVLPGLDALVDLLVTSRRP